MAHHPDWRGDSPLEWQRLVAELGRLGRHRGVWDLLQFRTDFVQHDIENQVCTIDEEERMAVGRRGQVRTPHQRQRSRAPSTDG
jgi:hypothetical protein